MRRLVATAALPVFIGLLLGVAALAVVLDSEKKEEKPAGPPTALADAERALFTEALLVKLGQSENNAFLLGGLAARPLAADPVRRHLALIAYRGLAARLESLRSAVLSTGPEERRDALLRAWAVYLKGAVVWLESQLEYARNPGFVKYMERPLTADRPYMVELDRLLARQEYERAEALGRMTLEQRALAWRRAESLSSATLRRTTIADAGN